MSDVLVACRKLRVGYVGEAILPEIDLEIRAGEFWAVIGRNGSGKTTWLRSVLGLLPPVSGSIETRKSGVRLSYLPQKKAMDELYPLLAKDVVAMGLERRWSFLKPRLGAPPKAVSDALEEMGVAALARQPFRSLSEGQKQRVLFARLALSGAEVAVLDEPTSAMDQVAENEAFGLLDGMRERHGLAIVIVSHYLGMVKKYADRALLLDRETSTVVSGDPDDVFRDERYKARFSDRPPAVKSLEVADA